MDKASPEQSMLRANITLAVVAGFFTYQLLPFLLDARVLGRLIAIAPWLMTGTAASGVLFFVLAHRWTRSPERSMGLLLLPAGLSILFTLLQVVIFSMTSQPEILHSAGPAGMFASIWMAILLTGASVVVSLVHRRSGRAWVPGMVIPAGMLVTTFAFVVIGKSPDTSTPVVGIPILMCIAMLVVAGMGLRKDDGPSATAKAFLFTALMLPAVMLCLAFGAFFITSTAIISAASSIVFEPGETAELITQGLSSEANSDLFLGLWVLCSIAVWSFLAAAVSQRYGAGRPSMQVSLLVVGILVVTMGANLWLRALLLEAAPWNPEMELGIGIVAAL